MEDGCIIADPSVSFRGYAGVCKIASRIAIVKTFMNNLLYTFRT